MKGLLFLFLFLPIYAAAQSISVIELKYRQAEEVIPLIQPLLPKGDAISGSGNQLFVRTRHLSEIRKLVKRIDRAQRALKVSVYQGSSIENVDDHETYSTESGDTYSLRMNEDTPGFVRMGESIRQDTVIATPYASGVSAQYRDVQRGFYVLPHLNGDRVTLAVSTLLDKPAGEGIDLARLSTRVSGRVGEWIELGGAMQGRQSDAVTAGHDTRIWIRVDLP